MCSTNIADVTRLRAADDEARRRVDVLSKRLAEVEGRLPAIERLISHIKGELPGISFSIHKTENPVCPICEVPLDRALAEGCKLSHKLPNPDEVRARWKKHEHDLNEETQRLEQDKAEQVRVKLELDDVKNYAENSRKHLETAENARDLRTDAWYKARRRIDDADRLDERLIAQQRAQLNVERLIQQSEAKREQAAAYREAQVDVFRYLSEFFDAIIRDLIGSTASGRIAFDGNGLRPIVELGGERSTAAIESLKVIAFDLAVMCMSIEGRTHIPAFLVHDSPREADLGLSVYHKLFHFARELEQIGTQPLFQYIVTTTTRPPDGLMRQPWLRETLRGAPAKERLLRRDL